jgi:hypothetical protein
MSVRGGTEGSPGRLNSSVVPSASPAAMPNTAPLYRSRLLVLSMCVLAYCLYVQVPRSTSSSNHFSSLTAVFAFSFYEMILEFFFF